MSHCPTIAEDHADTVFLAEQLGDIVDGIIAGLGIVGDDRGEDAIVDRLAVDGDELIADAAAEQGCAVGEFMEGKFLPEVGGDAALVVLCGDPFGGPGFIQPGLEPAVGGSRLAAFGVFQLDRPTILFTAFERPAFIAERLLGGFDPTGIPDLSLAGGSDGDAAGGLVLLGLIVGGAPREDGGFCCDGFAGAMVDLEADGLEGHRNAEKKII